MSTTHAMERSAGMPAFTPLMAAASASAAPGAISALALAQ